jgi:CRP-like cAMP-binding protein
LVAQKWAGIALIVVAAAGSLGPREWMHRMGRVNREIMADPIVAALARVPLFRALSPHDLATLATVTTMRPLDVGTVLTTEGEVGDEFFVIERGVVTISAHDQQLRTLGPGDFLGEIAIVFGGTRTATAVATEPGTLLVLPKADFLELLAANPAIEDKILATASERIRYG